MTGFKKGRGFALLILISLLVALQGQGCAPSPTPEVTVTVVATPIITEPPIPLGLNPSKRILNPGDQIVISVISDEWQAAELTWELFSDNEELKSPDALSASTGPTVVYTAPEGLGKVDISVQGRTKEKVGSAVVSFIIESIPEVGVVEFWTSPSRLEWDSERASEFSDLYPNVWVKIYPLSPEEARGNLLKAVAAGEPPDVVLFPWEDVGIFGEKDFLDADATTRIIREIGEEKFAPGSLKALFDPVDETWMAVPTEHGALGIMINSPNKSVAEAWVKLLTERELQSPTPACPSGVSCYNDDFSELDTKLWCKVPQEGFTVEGGQFVITANKDILYEIHPCEHLSWNLRFVELTLTIEEPTGPPGNAHTGIGASLSDDRYLNFCLDSAGNASLEHGYSASDIPPETDETIPLGRVGKSHTLRIEWTGNEVLFFVDGSQLDTRIASSGYGSWFFLYARAYTGASIVARFDSVRWGVSP